MLGDAELLARVIEVLPGGVVQVAPDGAILRANAQAQRFLGLDWDELHARFVQSFEGATFHEDGRSCSASDHPVVRCLTTGRSAGPTTIGVRQPDGEVRWAIFTALPCAIPSHDRPGAVVTFVDITERMRSESRDRALAQVIESTRSVHSRMATPSASSPVFDEPLRTLVTLTSSRFGALASLPPGDPPADELLVHASIESEKGALERAASGPPVPIDALSAKAVATGKPVVLEERMRPGGAFTRRSVDRALVLPLRAGDRTLGVAILADAPAPYSEQQVQFLEPLCRGCADLLDALEQQRERERLASQLAQTERLASVGTLAAGMAHEINNPLAYLVLNLEGACQKADALRAELDAAGQGSVAERVARIAQHARDAAEGAERVQRLVRDMMTFSRVGQETFAQVDVNAAVDVAIKMADHEIKYRARLVRELGDIAPVRGNDGKLSQVFLNLLLNAARAIEEGRADQNEIGVRTSLHGDEVRVEIWDTGLGIAPEHLDRLFEPFFTTRAAGEGSGLGLSICHNVVRAHGGRIDVQSDPGRGSKFIVVLPRAARAPRAAPPAARAPSQPATRLRILVVDDEAMVLRVLGQLLSHHYDVTTAEGIAPARALLEKDDFDVVLCDMMMLDGTGTDLYAWAAEHRPGLSERFVFMTGGAFTPKAREFLNGTKARRLGKPFQLRELQEILSTLPPRGAGV